MPLNEKWMRPEVAEDLQRRDFERMFRAQLELTKVHGEALTKEYREKTAATLLSAGILLIPSEYLRDHEFVVSMGVYEAAKKITGG